MSTFREVPAGLYTVVCRFSRLPYGDTSRDPGAVVLALGASPYSMFSNMSRLTLLAWTS